ncbi:isocitrate lyase/PEP mutase family protein [Streptomyces sp. NPDC002346]
MSSSEKKTTRLKALFHRPETTLMPFGVLPLHAQMAQAAGFEAFEVSGGMSCWWVGGVSDVGLLTLTEIVEHAGRVARSVDIPVYCDADTGYGGPANVRRTVHDFIRAGVAGIHIEDQKEPKKAGGQTGIELVSDAEAVGRLNAACDARDELDEDFVIVARTDGYGAAGGGLEEAIRRGRLYREETDADVIFYEGLHTWDEIRTALAETPGPAYAIPSQTVGRRPPLAELTAMGQTIDIVPFLLPGVQEVWRLLVDIKEAGEYGPMDDYIEKLAAGRGSVYDIGWGDAFVRPSYAEVRAMEEKYLPPELQRDYLNNANAAG